MISEHMALILYVTGVITSSTIIQFFAPKASLRLLNNVELNDEVGLFLARHWGLLVFSIGVLLIYAGYDASARTPILIGAIIEKVGIVSLVLFNRKKPFVKGYILTALFDSCCVIIYLLYLIGLA
ncbi:MAG: hypothetical protein PHY31_00410 [Smithellaceae bacterium]|nr:hypothetical protein [Smithellaceae bacterium]